MECHAPGRLREGFVFLCHAMDVTLSGDQLVGPCLGSSAEETPSISSSGPIFLCTGLGWCREPGRSHGLGSVVT